MAHSTIENPVSARGLSDDAGNNVYEFTVTATSGTGTRELSIATRVDVVTDPGFEDVYEPPSVHWP